MIFFLIWIFLILLFFQNVVNSYTRSTSNISNIFFNFKKISTVFGFFDFFITFCYIIRFVNATQPASQHNKNLNHTVSLTTQPASIHRTKSSFSTTQPLLMTSPPIRIISSTYLDIFNNEMMILYIFFCFEYTDASSAYIPGANKERHSNIVRASEQ